MIINSNIIYNNQTKKFDFSKNHRIGRIQENILSICNLYIYGIEYTEIVFEDNSVYKLGDDNMDFNLKFIDFIEKENKNDIKIKYFQVFDRKRDEKGNVIKDNKIIEKYQTFLDSPQSNIYDSNSINLNHLTNLPNLNNLMNLPILQNISEEDMQNSINLVSSILNETPSSSTSNLNNQSERFLRETVSMLSSSFFNVGFQNASLSSLRRNNNYHNNSHNNNSKNKYDDNDDDNEENDENNNDELAQRLENDENEAQSLEENHNEKNDNDENEENEKDKENEENDENDENERETLTLSFDIRIPRNYINTNNSEENEEESKEEIDSSSSTLRTTERLNHIISNEFDNIINLINSHRQNQRSSQRNNRENNNTSEENQNQNSNNFESFISNLENNIINEINNPFNGVNIREENNINIPPPIPLSYTRYRTNVPRFSWTTSLDNFESFGIENMSIIGNQNDLPLNIPFGNLDAVEGLMNSFFGSNNIRIIGAGGVLHELNEDVKVVVPEEEFNKLKEDEIDENSELYEKYKDKQCSICIGSYVNGEKVIITSCDHVFHKECVENWFKKESNKCPFCRKEVCKGKALLNENPIFTFSNNHNNEYNDSDDESDRTSVDESNEDSNNEEL